MPKTIIGTVSSSSSDKTIIVRVERRKTHPLYRKQYLSSTKFAAHDEKNEAQIGDRVAIVECRPLSATKHFKLARIVERPALREEALAAIKVEEAPKPAKKSKAEEAEEKSS